jgi:hypothetical protein
MRINGGIRQQLLAAGHGVSLLQPIALGAVGSILLGAAAGDVRTQQTLNTEAIGRIAQAITVRIEGATQGSGVLVKREGNRYTVLTAWHLVPLWPGRWRNASGRAVDEQLNQKLDLVSLGVSIKNIARAVKAAAIPRGAELDRLMEVDCNKSMDPAKPALPSSKTSPNW